VFDIAATQKRQEISFDPDNPDPDYYRRKFRQLCAKMGRKSTRGVRSLSENIAPGVHIRFDSTRECNNTKCIKRLNIAGLYIGTGFKNKDDPRNGEITYCPNCGHTDRPKNTGYTDLNTKQEAK